MAPASYSVSRDVAIVPDGGQNQIAFLNPYSRRGVLEQSNQLGYLGRELQLGTQPRSSHNFAATLERSNQLGYIGRKLQTGIQPRSSHIVVGIHKLFCLLPGSFPVFVTFRTNHSRAEFMFAPVPAKFGSIAQVITLKSQGPCSFYHSNAAE
jgi:hypothetical protein